MYPVTMGNNIEPFLSELCQASICPEVSTYNGITEKQSSNSYHKMIEKLYNCAISDLYSLDELRRGIVRKRINEAREKQKYFDIPTKETVEAMLRDYNSQPEGRRSKSLLDEYRFCKFVLECVSIQKDYLQRFASLLIIGQETRTTDAPNTNIPNALTKKGGTARVETAAKEWLTVEEVAEIYGLPKNNIKSRQWRIDNDFPYKGFDENKGAYCKVVFSKEHVEAWIRNHK